MLEKMDAFFARRLEDYDQHMLTTIAGAGEFYPFTASQLPMNKNCEILDLGCGTGLELEAYFALNPCAQITGVDLSAAMLNALTRKFPDKAMQLIHASYFDIPFAAQRYDAVVSVESLHHFLPEQKLSLYSKLVHALRVDGYFILTDYFAESSELEQMYFHSLKRLKAAEHITDEAFYHYDTPLTVEHEMQLLSQAGFSDVRILKNWGATYTLKATR